MGYDFRHYPDVQQGTSPNLAGLAVLDKPRERLDVVKVPQ
jgi:hypothetical protein